MFKNKKSNSHNNKKLQNEMNDDDFLLANNVDISKYDSSYEESRIDEIKQTKTFNPIKKIKNNKEIKLLEQEIERKLNSKKRKIAQIKKRIKRFNAIKAYYRYAFLCLAVIALIFLGTFIYNAIDSKIHQIKEINFITKEDNIYIGDKISVDYTISPDNAKYDVNDIEIVCNGKNVKNVSFSNIGVYKFNINYKGLTYDSKTVEVLPIKVSEIKTEDVLVGVNHSKEINLDIYPENATDKKIEFLVEDATIAKIENYRVFGLKEGTTVAHAKSKDGVESTFKIDVQYIKIESLSIEIIDNDYKAGDKVYLRTTISPKENSSTSKVEYKSLNPNVVKVDENGNFVAVAAGSATIVATIDGLKSSTTVKVKSQINEESVSNNTNTSSTSTKETEKSSTSSNNNYQSINHSESGCTYVLNTSRKVFHYSYCSYINNMKEKNKGYSDADRETLINSGYKPCGHCHP